MKMSKVSSDTTKTKISTKADKFVAAFIKAEKGDGYIGNQAYDFVNMSAPEQKAILGKLSEKSRINLSDYISSILCGYTLKDGSRDAIGKKAVALIQYRDETHAGRGNYNIIDPESGRDLKIVKRQLDQSPNHSFVILGSTEGKGISRIYC